MNVQQLIEILSEMDPEAEVRLATQMNYPLQSSVFGVASSKEMNENVWCDMHNVTDCEECADDIEVESDNVVWIAEGSQNRRNPYASRDIWEQATR